MGLQSRGAGSASVQHLIASLWLRTRALRSPHCFLNQSEAGAFVTADVIRHYQVSAAMPAASKRRSKRDPQGLESASSAVRRSRTSPLGRCLVRQRRSQVVSPSSAKPCLRHSSGGYSFGRPSCPVASRDSDARKAHLRSPFNGDYALITFLFDTEAGLSIEVISQSLAHRRLWAKCSQLVGALQLQVLALLDRPTIGEGDVVDGELTNVVRPDGALEQLLLEDEPLRLHPSAWQEGLLDCARSVGRGGNASASHPTSGRAKRLRLSRKRRVVGSRSPFAPWCPPRNRNDAK